MAAEDSTTRDEDETLEPANPHYALPALEAGLKRVFCERVIVKPVGVDAFVLDRNGGDDARGCLMAKIRILSDEVDAGENAFDEYVCAVHELFYDVPVDDALADDYDADLTIAFSRAGTG